MLVSCRVSSFLVSLLSGAQRFDRSGVNELRYLADERNDNSWFMFWGGFVSLMAETFDGSGLIPSLVRMCP